MFKNQVLKDIIEKKATPDRFQRGKSIYEAGDVYFVEKPAVIEAEIKLQFIVLSSSRSSPYAVKFNKILTNQMGTDCTCPDSGICKHIVAAALLLSEYVPIELETNEVEQVESFLPKAVVFKQTKTELVPVDKVQSFKMNEEVQTKLITLRDDDEIKGLSTPTEFQAGRKLFNYEGILVLGFVKEAIMIGIKPTYYLKNPFENKVTFRLNGDKLLSQCNCRAVIEAPLCRHKVAALIYMGFKYMKWSDAKSGLDEINEILKPFGLTYDTPGRERYFVLDFLNSNFGLQKLDASLLPVLGESKAITPPTFQLGKRSTVKVKIEKRIFLWAIIPEDEINPVARLIPILANFNAKTGNLTSVVSAFKLEPDKYLHLMSDTDVAISKLASEAFNTNAKDPIDEFLYKVFGAAHQVFALAKDLPALYKAETNYNDSIKKTSQISIGNIIRISLLVTETKDFYTVEGRFKCGEQWLNFDDGEMLGYAFFMYEDTIYCMPSAIDLLRLQTLAENHYKIKVLKINDFSSFYNTFVSELSPYFQVDYQVKNIRFSKKIMEPVSSILYLEDDENENLHLTPVFKYRFRDVEAEFTNVGTGNFSYAEGNEVQEYYRNSEWESNYIQQIERFHPKFANQKGAEYYSLSFNEAMTNGWISSLAEAARNADIILLGEKTFKNFKYSTAASKFDIQISSGIDWFDVKPMLLFGEEKVSIKKIKQAVLEGKQYVVLSDGTFGMLPSQWLQKLAPLFRLGVEDKNGVKLRANHGHMMSDLAEWAGKDDLVQTLHGKYTNLLAVEKLTAAKLPKKLEATLRPYQFQGYSWLRYHENLGFGALLADDMGLGKTLQVLTQLTAICEENKKARHLIVMPTALLYNWRNEATKFSPHLIVATYHGAARHGDKSWQKANMVLTTYGTLRSDVEIFGEEKWDYIVLDESQAIKNPETAVAKSVKVLRSRNRIAMTGTPVENRTMDLYSQLDFLNPGLLGSADSFMKYYAKPIDKDSNEVMALELRKLVAPFILRRTKEQVATDLPEKTETILYCNLSASQEKVYNETKENYRNEIVDLISQGGRNAAGLLILAGLTKLRQIADSAAIVRPELANSANHSTKLDVLIEELKSVSENNKVLVFSNFLSMMDLIKVRLDAEGIGYCYMDGSTKDRENEVETFKGTKSKRVFLLTMKVGGVGLNLTEAGYVYIVDPWWNPAAEQQAIDRTHRIGQTNPVFAYKMITVGTVEEKIIELQKRKKKLASDLISTDENILSSLSDTEMLDLFK